MDSDQECLELEDEKSDLESDDLTISPDFLKQAKENQDFQISKKSNQQTSEKEYKKIVNLNYQLIDAIQNLKRKLKIQKIHYQLIFEEKDKKINDLKEQINQIQSLLRKEKVEMRERYNRIQSLSNSDVSLYQTQLESDFYIENKKKQEAEKINQKNEFFKSLIYELTQKNDEKESIIQSLTETNEQTNILLLKCKQKINELNHDKSENELQIELLKENKVQLENQIQELKDNNQKIEKEYKKIIHKLKLDNDSIIKDLILNKETNQNLTDSTQIKEFKGLIKKQQNDLDDKENLINRLKIIINNNQDKINRLETEKVILNEQLKFHEENNQQISDIIQSYKIQNFEIRMLLKKINESNHPLKNQICAIILDLDKMINENQKKDKIISGLKVDFNK